MALYTYKIVINGVVQGVGFRPFIYKLAKELNLNGQIKNFSGGVEILINASKSKLQKFLDSIELNLPPLAKIDSITYKQIDFVEFKEFKILKSTSLDSSYTNIPPDLSICKECEKELFDKNNRRYLYPFITCTNCGVRYSIIYKLPYDRKNTSMKFFKMCNKCYKEYTNPLDRRYHAQPIGCWECGPVLKIFDSNNKELHINNILEFAKEQLKRGKILALKGVGGYHLICDATNTNAIKLLRKRKNRPKKPFAIMVKDINEALKLAHINSKEKELLLSNKRPIVLLKQKTKLNSLIAPDISKIGIFLPYTPLHLLLLKDIDFPVIATSANLSDEPIATNFNEVTKLNYIYDYLIDHNRKIVNGCDDSVIMVVKDKIVTIRRARGYTPQQIKLPFNLPCPTLAVGANQKNTIAIGFKDSAIISPHIGDLNSIGSIEYFKKTIKNLSLIYNFKPQRVVCDLHPNYETTKFAKSLSRELNIPLIQKQHHYAHILSVMIEKKIETKAFGISFDGTGVGDDGNLWGGEFLICDYKGYKRVAHIEYFKLLGATKAIKEPRRVALSFLFEIYGKEALNLNTPTTKAFSKSELSSLYLAWQKGLNSPLSSSMGRIFDAVASILDINQIVSFEGQSGMLLEELYSCDIKEHYKFNIKNNQIDFKPMFKELLEAKNKTVAVSKFFNTIVKIIETIYKPYSHLSLLLSGGVFQNRVLLELILTKFPNAIISNKVPPNDGGISLGQLI